MFLSQFNLEKLIPLRLNGGIILMIILETVEDQGMSILKKMITTYIQLRSSFQECACIMMFMAGKINNS